MLKILFRPILLLLSSIMMVMGLSEIPQNAKQQADDSDKQGGLTVRFLDVGQADAAIIIADGEAMLIDGGNVSDSSLIVSALRRSGVSHLKAMICTHAHEDHVGGLAAALKACSVETVYSPVLEYDSQCFSDFVTYAKKRGKELTVPKQGDGFSLGGATVRFLSPVAYSESVNDTSLVLRVEYGAHSFLFMADAEREAEKQLLDAGLLRQATVLKVGHHGSDSSTSYAFLREVMPKYAVISVEKGNEYGFPDAVVLSRLADAESLIYRTDQCGEIRIRTDGERMEIESEHGFDPAASIKAGQTGESIPVHAAYIGNRNSMKFHKPVCGSLPSEKNRRYFSSRSEAVEAGYLPCGQCKP